MYFKFLLNFFAVNMDRIYSLIRNFGVTKFQDRIGNPPWERNFGRVESTGGSEPEVTRNPLKRSKVLTALRTTL